MSGRLRTSGAGGVCALLAACSLPALAALGPRYGGDLRVGVARLPASTTPVVPADAAERLVGGLVHETLLHIDRDGLPAAGLAESWVPAAGGREWTLTLRADARFQDDAPITAEDAVRSLRRFLADRSAAAAHLADGLEVDGLAAPDTRHLVLRFVEPRALPLSPLASPAAALASRGGAGSGPFQPVLLIPGRRLALTAYPGHVRGRPYLDHVDVIQVSEPQGLSADLGARRIDVALGKTGPSSLAATLLLVLDASRPPFDRQDARAAVVSAVDRGDLVKQLLPGGDPAASLLVPALLAPLTEETVLPAERAAGAITLVVARDVPPLVSQRVVAHLEAIGLRVVADPRDPGEARSAPAQARLLLFSPEIAEAGLVLEELAALARAPSEAGTALAAAAARELDINQRRTLLHRAEAVLRSDSVLVPLASVPVSSGVRPGVHGLSVDLSGRTLLEDAWLEP